jgi:hypothetical protein
VATCSGDERNSSGALQPCLMDNQLKPRVIRFYTHRLESPPPRTIVSVEIPCSAAWFGVARLLPDRQMVCSITATSRSRNYRVSLYGLCSPGFHSISGEADIRDDKVPSM